MSFSTELLIKVLVVLATAPVMALGLTLLEVKGSAWMQRRPGPLHVGLRGFIKNMSYDVFANYRNISFRYSDDSKSENLNRLYVGGTYECWLHRKTAQGQLHFGAT